jgi:hypothetical protein
MKQVSGTGTNLPPPSLKHEKWPPGGNFEKFQNSKMTYITPN